MPCPVSETRRIALLSEQRSATATRPPSGVNLIAFESRFQIDLMQPRFVAVDAERPLLDIRFERDVALLGARLEHLHDRFDDRPQLHRRAGRREACRR